MAAGDITRMYPVDDSFYTRDKASMAQEIDQLREWRLHVNETMAQLRRELVEMADEPANHKIFNDGYVYGLSAAAGRINTVLEDARF